MLFQVAEGGPAASACVSGLTVVGTGSVRAGTSREAGAAVWAFPAGTTRTIASAPIASANAKPPVKWLQKGVIGLQTYGAEGHAGWVKFRNIRIREIQ